MLITIKILCICRNILINEGDNMKKRIHKYLEIRDLKDMLKKTGELYGDNPAFKLKTNQSGVLKIITHKEFRDMVNELGTALIDMGLKDKKIAVMGENRYEWGVAYLSIITGTGIVVPLDKGLTEIELRDLIKRSKVEAIFYSKKYNEVIEKIQGDKVGNLKKFISMDARESNDKVLSMNDLIKKGEELIKKGDKRFLEAEINPNETAAILFTSGTTSLSKAVALSHTNICTNIMDIASVIKLVPSDTMLSMLPIHHAFECTVGFLYPVYVGCSLAYCEGIRHILDNIKEYEISVMISVPALYENMYKNIMKNIKKKGKTETIKKAIKISKFLLKFKIDIRKILFKEIHQALGGRTRLFINGAAALDPEVEQAFTDLGFLIAQGYGLTETSPVISSGNDKYRRTGSVGQVFPSVEIKIAEPNEQGIGEVVVKGPSVMLGYYENEEANKAVFKDGWFHTGDLGYMDKDGFLYLTGRKKNVIVLGNGKNVYPEELENLVSKLEEVKENFVFGMPDKDGDLKVSIKVVYNKEYIEENYGIKDEKEIRDLIWEKIKEINKKMPKYKYIKELIITEEELIKTSTAKVKRHEELAKILKEK